MLIQLNISNYALIRDLEIRFPGGLTAVTGETGAGKSIILGALSLILGKRADSRVLFQKNHKCIVEGQFDIGNYHMESLFNKADLDYDKRTIIRREINAKGKSRAFINDTPVRLDQLQQLAGRLVQIHSQHETLDLQQSQFQLGVLDSLAGNAAQISKYSNLFGQWKDKTMLRATLLEEHRKALAEKDYVQFQFDELTGADLDEIDQSQLEGKLRELRHAEEIKTALGKAALLLSGQENSLISSLGQVSGLIRSVAGLKSEAETLEKRLESSLIELQDMADELYKLEENTNLDDESAELINNTLDELYRLQNKHGVQNIEQLIELRDRFDEQLQQIDRGQGDVESLDSEIDALLKQMSQTAASLTKKRAGAARKLEKSTTALLGDVGMPQAKLLVKIESRPKEPGPQGCDKVQFLFSANKGAPADEIKHIASGGELSRLMLCIKSQMASSSAMPTLIFDEIDAGISGETGRKVAQIMQRMGKNHQLIVITHLPQIAGVGDQHFFVYKNAKNELPDTRIRALDSDERITELAKMLAGENVSEAALANAKELMSQ